MRALARSGAVARIVASMAPRKLPKTLSADEVAALFAAPNRAAPTGLRNLGILTLMHRCGLRVSEACGLHLRDVRLDDGQLHLRPEIAKGGREAFAYLDHQAIELLRSWIVVRRRYAARRPHLFTTLRGGPVSRKYCWAMMRRYARRAGIDRPVHPHMLRHTYATELLREGFNVREVQQLLRHADIRTTVAYTHIFEADLARKIRERT
jgi:integrase/recombinase XerD